LGDDEEMEEDKGKEEGEVTPSLHSPPPEDLPSLGDLFSHQAGIFVGAHRPKHPRIGAGASSVLSPQSCLTLVSSDLQGMFALVVMGTTHLLKVS
jgi:hypothetical protein